MVNLFLSYVSARRETIVQMNALHHYYVTSSVSEK